MRLDLANAYVRFEEALLERDPEGAELAAVSAALDRATGRFFLGDAAGAIAALDAARAGLLPTGADRIAARAASALRIELDPPHGWLEAQAAPAVVLTRIYELDVGEEGEETSGREPVPLRVVLSHPGGALLREVDFELSCDLAGAVRIELGGELEQTEPANLLIELCDSSGRVHGRRTWPLLRTDPVQFAFTMRFIAQALPDVAAYVGPARAWVTFLDRIGLLDPQGRAEQGARMATDLVQLEADLAVELDIFSGITAWGRAHERNPYRDRPGALWRIARLDGVEVPLWIVAPELEPGAPAPPLVIAFHGAGGEESQWLEAYGRGVLVARAREQGFLLALPRTYPLVGSPERVIALLEDLAQDHLFDPRRVLALGHSMGAAAAAELANHSPGLLCGVALLAGGANLRPSADLPRTLFVLGAHDRIVPPAPCRRAAERARAAGAQVEVIELEHHGHTTLVPAALEAALRLLDP